LVFDNARDRASLEPFLPPAGRGRILITTQNQEWPRGQALDVPVLGLDAAAAFLTARTGDPDPAARDLAVMLGGLPLALEQAAAYMQATGTSLARYRSLFRERQADLLARGETAGHREGVAATFGLALSRLAGEAPDAAALVRLLAFLAPEPVPLTLLLSGTEVRGQLEPGAAAQIGPLIGDPLAVGDAVSALRRYSLVTLAGPGLVQAHRLVQAVTRAQLTAQAAGQWEQAAAALVELAVPDDVRVPSAWPTCAALLPHAQAVLAPTSRGIRQISHYLWYSGSHRAAWDLGQQITEAFRVSEDHGPEHPDSLDARSNLARWTGIVGDAAGGRDRLAALVPVFARILGPEHPDTLIIRGNLVYWTGEAGDPAGARDQFAALLPVFERVLGPEHFHTLVIRGNHARWIGEAGDMVGAREQTAAFLPGCERVLGPEHLITLGFRGSLAVWTGETGDPAGARDQFAALLSVHERILGPKQLYTITARGELAHWTGQAGDAPGARDQFAALVPVHEQFFGLEHPYTLGIRSSLRYWTDAAKRGDQPAAALPVSERLPQAEHPYRHSLARWGRPDAVPEPKRIDESAEPVQRPDL
jgi:hypothetical protein